VTTPETTLEAEARSIAALPHLSQRRAWLEYIERTHGKEKADKLRAAMKAIWDADNGTQGS
jgi:monoamine oxidase